MKRLLAIASTEWWTRSVSRRIGAILFAALLLTVAMGVVSLRGLSTLAGQLDRTVERQGQAAGLVGEMLHQSQRLSDSARRAAAASNDSERDAALAELEAAKKALGERIDVISAQLEDAPELQAALQEGLSSFVISAVKASRLIGAGRHEDAERELLTSFDPKLLAYVLTTVSGVSEHTDESVKAAAASGHAAYDHTLRLLIPILAAVAVAAVVGLWLLRRTVIRPVQRVASAAKQLAQGCFDIDLTTSSRDECGEMLRAMADLREQLAAMIATIESAAGEVTDTADRLAEGNRDLSDRSTTQAKALRAAAESLASLNDMTKRSAEHSHQVSRDMGAASDAAAHGKAVVQRLVTTMQATAEASRRIADTVGMIEEIAFKTNILALNAAVEAARAGEHGRSFAVVAAEVRDLAGKSATAAKEIAALITSSSDKVADGMRLVADTGTSIGNIVQQVQAATARMSEISDASREQSHRAEDVTRAIAEIDASTQRNAQMVHEASSATEVLRSEARALNASIAEFTRQSVDATDSETTGYSEIEERAIERAA